MPLKVSWDVSREAVPVWVLGPGTSLREPKVLPAQIHPWGKGGRVALFTNGTQSVIGQRSFLSREAAMVQLATRARKIASNLYIRWNMPAKWQMACDFLRKHGQPIPSPIDNKKRSNATSDA